MATYVTLEQAKDHIRVDFDDDDTYIEALLDVAETSVLNEIRGQITGAGTVTTNATVNLTGTDTTFTDFKAGDIIKVVGESSTRTISSVTIDTALIVTVAFSTSASGKAYTIEPSPLVSGVLPKPIYQAILLMVGQLYEQREPINVGNIVTKLPFTLEYLLAPYKNWVLK
jgi:hypothetical protein